MLDHLGYITRDFDVSRAFYLKAFKPLGYGIVMEFEHEGQKHIGFGKDKPDFWLSTGKVPLSGRMHLAFAAENRAAVDAFYEAAIAAGGQDNGKPGLRPHYHADYYGAFVIDPDGHNIEAVCHKPE